METLPYLRPVQPQTVDHLRDRLTHPRTTSSMCTPTRRSLTTTNLRGAFIHPLLALVLLCGAAESGCQEPPAPEVVLGPAEPHPETLTEQLDELSQSAEATRALVEEASAKLIKLDARLTSGLRLREVVEAHQALLIGALDAMPDEDERCAALGCPASRGVLESFEVMRTLGEAGWVKDSVTTSIDSQSDAVAVVATLTLRHPCSRQGLQVNHVLPGQCHPTADVPIMRCLKARFERTEGGDNIQASPWTQAACSRESLTQ